MKKLLLMTTLLLASIVGAQAQKLATTAPQLKQKVVNVPKLDGRLQKVDFNKSALTMARKNVAPGQVTSRPMQAKRAAGSAPSDLDVSDITANSATVMWSGDFASYEVRYKKASENLSEGTVFFESFEEVDEETGLPAGWTSIDADGDKYNWEWLTASGDQVNTHSGDGLMSSASYDNPTYTALNPDNWLITPLVDLQGTVKMWMYGQDPSWSAEHFAVYVSTTGNSIEDFDVQNPLIPETIVTGKYVQYSADLSEYEGQQGYIAIRHFDVTDMFRLNLDDFGIYAADDDGDWTMVSTEENSITLTDLDPDNAYGVQVRGICKDEEGNPVTDEEGNPVWSDWSPLLQFTTLEEGGMDWETWYLNGFDSDDASLSNREVQVKYNLVKNTILVDGLCPYLSNCVVEGTLNGDGTATFATGQYYGNYNDTYDMYFAGYSNSAISDVVFNIDLDEGFMSTESLILLMIDDPTSTDSMVDYYYNVTISREKQPYDIPTDLEASDITTNSATLSWVDNCEEEVTQWVVRYSPIVVVSVDEQGNKTFDYAEDGELLQEIVVDDNSYTLTDLEEGTYYVVWVRPEPAEDMWSNYIIFNTIVDAVPAVPADPFANEWYDSGSDSGYSYFKFKLPDTDVDGKMILPEYVSFSIFTDDDQPFTFWVNEYSQDIEEDMTEIPYEVYSAGKYDIYSTKVYFYRTNEVEDGETPFFTKRIGIQAHYTVDGVKNSSNIVYWNLPIDIATGITNVTANEGNDTWYTIDGRKLSAKPMTKGVFIKNGQKVVNK